MLSTAITFANLLSAALLVGAMFGVWLVFNPEGLDARTYIDLQQRAIFALNGVMPKMGAITVLLTLVAAILARGDSQRLWMLVGAIVCLVAGALITRFLNQPINAIVMKWSSGAPPKDWMSLRDQWWKWHIVRLVAGLGGLGLLIAATLKRCL